MNVAALVEDGNRLLKGGTANIDGSQERRLFLNYLVSPERRARYTEMRPDLLNQRLSEVHIEDFGHVGIIV